MAPKQHRDHAMSFSGSLIPCPVNESRADLQENTPWLLRGGDNEVPSSSRSNARGQELPNAAGSQVSLAESHQPHPLGAQPALLETSLWAGG